LLDPSMLSAFLGFLGSLAKLAGVLGEALAPKAGGTNRRQANASTRLAVGQDLQATEPGAGELAVSLPARRSR
jgi:hypothetical protein